MIKGFTAIFIGLVVYYIGYFLMKTMKKSRDRKKEEESTQTYQIPIDESIVEEQEKKN